MGVRDEIQLAKRGIPRQDKRRSYAQKLNEHQLVKSVMEDTKPLLPVFLASALAWARTQPREAKKQAGAKTLAVINRNSGVEAYPKQYQYPLDVFQNLTNVLSVIERFEEIQVFLGGYPQPTRYRHLGITQDKWIHYHYSHFVVVALSLFDASLLLVNSVFEFGLEPRHCSPETILKNRHIKGSEVGKALATIDRVVAVHRQPRHLFAHRGKLPKLELLDVMELFSASERFDNPVLDTDTIDSLYRIAKHELTTALNQEIEVIVADAVELLDSLLPEYQRRCAIPRSTAGLNSGKAAT